VRVGKGFSRKERTAASKSNKKKGELDALFFGEEGQEQESAGVKCLSLVKRKGGNVWGLAKEENASTAERLRQKRTV